jgi:hypothetical protein
VKCLEAFDCLFDLASDVLRADLRSVTVEPPGELLIAVNEAARVV